MAIVPQIANNSRATNNKRATNKQKQNAIWFVASGIEYDVVRSMLVACGMKYFLIRSMWE